MNRGIMDSISLQLWRKINHFYVQQLFYSYNSIGPILDDRLNGITLVNLCFQATGLSFSCRNMISGLREPCTIRNWRLLTFFENSIFYGYMGHFFDFWAIFPYNFGDSWDIHGMRHIILGYFFPRIMVEIRTYHFRIPLVQEGQFSHFFKVNF